MRPLSRVPEPNSAYFSGGDMSFAKSSDPVGGAVRGSTDRGASSMVVVLVLAVAVAVASLKTGVMMMSNGRRKVRFFISESGVVL